MGVLSDPRDEDQVYLRVQMYAQLHGWALFMETFFHTVITLFSILLLFYIRKSAIVQLEEKRVVFPVE